MYIIYMLRIRFQEIQKKYLKFKKKKKIFSLLEKLKSQLIE